MSEAREALETAGLTLSDGQVLHHDYMMLEVGLRQANANNTAKFD